MPRFMTPEQKKQGYKDHAKRQREWLKTLTPEQLAERKEQLKWRKEDTARKSAERKRETEHKKNIKRELAILKFMLKTDVPYLHHGRTDSMKTEIENAIARVGYSDNHLEYDSYFWNYNTAKSSYMPISQLGCLWRGDFDTIYDVPLDGTYKFHIYDSGSRGMGSMNHITCEKVEAEIKAPYVNPGAFVPITIR